MLLYTAYFLALLSSAFTVPTAQNEADLLEAKMHPELPTALFPPNSPNSPFDARSRSAESTQAYWIEQGRAYVRQHVQQVQRRKMAKNLILFVGDGMSLATLAATRSYIGGESRELSFEHFATTGLAKTYAIDGLVADSACTATAYLCGVKANIGTIGVNGRVQRGDCKAMQNTTNHVNSLAQWALDAKKAAGVVTTASLTDASPAGLYAHTANRAWQNDAVLKKDCGESDENRQDIAMQMIYGEVGSRLKVMLGGGQSNFQTNGGERQDGRDLLQEFLKQNARNKLVNSRESLMSLNAEQTERVLGIFSPKNMAYNLEGAESQPTLSEMTAKALEVLQTETNGYVLFVEGGLIDLAHHATKAHLALDETAELSQAVAVARAMTSEEDTLIVVTADHSHTFSLAGYQRRGSDIFGPADALAADGQPYLALSYANGPSFEQFFDEQSSSRKNPQAVLTGSSNDRFPATVPLAFETHGAEDVAVFASGPWEQLFSGVYEQHVIPHLMAYAACIGEGLKACLRY